MKRTVKKLGLSRETVRLLSVDQLGGAAGGNTPPKTQPATTMSCNPCPGTNSAIMCSDNSCFACQ